MKTFSKTDIKTSSMFAIRKGAAQIGLRMIGIFEKSEVNKIFYLYKLTLNTLWTDL